MRALWIPAALLVGIFLLTMLNSRYVAHQTDGWLRQLEQVDTAADREDWPSAIALTQQVYKSWNAKQPYLHSAIQHEELDEAEALFRQLLVVCDEEDAAEARLHLAQLCSKLRFLAEMEKLSIPNIL